MFQFLKVRGSAFIFIGLCDFPFVTIKFSPTLCGETGHPGWSCHAPQSPQPAAHGLLGTHLLYQSTHTFALTKV